MTKQGKEAPREGAGGDSQGQEEVEGGEQSLRWPSMAHRSFLAEMCSGTGCQVSRDKNCNSS
jgi:hypothetical protein